MIQITMSLFMSNVLMDKKSKFTGSFMLIGFILSLGLLLSLPNVGSAETYTWKDENGRVHFGDAPPDKETGVSVKQIEIKEANPPIVDAEVIKRRAKQYKLLEAYHEESMERKIVEEKQKKKAKRNKAACIRAKDNLKHYEGRAVFYRLNEDGSRSYISEEEKLKTRNRLREKIKKNCK